MKRLKSRRRPMAAKAVVSNQVLIKCAASFKKLGNGRKLLATQIMRKANTYQGIGILRLVRLVGLVVASAVTLAFV